MGKILTPVEAIEDHHLRCAREARQRFGLAVRPIYASNDRRRPEPVGSSVLIEIESERCVVTAAHVLLHGSLHLGGARDVIPLNAEFAISDTIDVAVAILSEDQVRALDGLPFIVPADQLRSTLDDRSRYLLATGYRISQNHAPIDGSKKLRPMRWSYTGVGTELPQREKRHANGAFNFAMAYPKHAVRESGERLKTTPPRGISGGAIFDLGNTLSVEQLGAATPHPPKLAGIVIECPTTGAVLIGTKIEAIHIAAEKARARQSTRLFDS